ncbi:MAG: aldo/keto reductase [Acidobacteria bacterium]|jgi:aryl-alcohol dehydrogenase-like predicted oxidoreductase|nr:aldo/keto reductase [Acidobacteriota bacterium]
MKKHTRRAFLRTSAGGAGLLAAAPSLLEALDAGRTTSFAGSDVVTLGKTGIKVSRLAQGTGFNGGSQSSAHTRLGQEAFSRLLHHSLDEGVTFLDMADLYGSHPYVLKTVKDVPRDNLVYLSKLWPRKEDWITPSGGAKREVTRFLKELGTDHLDVCLIHCMLNDQWPTEYEHIRDELSQLKESGEVRAVGVSCHDFGALKVAAEHPWVDVIFARINDKGGREYSCDASAPEVAEVLKTARANGKAVVGMKIFGAGKLVEPEEKDASLKYVFGNDLVDAVTIGMLSTDQVDDTLQRMARVRVS